MSWTTSYQRVFLNKRLGNRNEMPTMGLSSFGLEGEPPGTHGNYTVKDRRDRKMWNTLFSATERKKARS